MYTGTYEETRVCASVRVLEKIGLPFEYDIYVLLICYFETQEPPGSCTLPLVVSWTIL